MDIGKANGKGNYIVFSISTKLSPSRKRAGCLVDRKSKFLGLNVVYRADTKVLPLVDVGAKPELSAMFFKNLRTGPTMGQNPVFQHVVKRVYQRERKDGGNKIRSLKVISSTCYFEFFPNFKSVLNAMPSCSKLQKVLSQLFWVLFNFCKSFHGHISYIYM